MFILITRSWSKPNFKLNFRNNKNTIYNFFRCATSVDDDEDDWFFGSEVFATDTVSATQTETGKYLADEKISPKADPLIYWKNRSITSPNLAEMAKIYLAIPATSAPSERAFSQGRLIVDHTRARLTAEHLTALMCLKSWRTSNIFWTQLYVFYLIFVFYLYFLRI